MRKKTGEIGFERNAFRLAVEPLTRESSIQDLETMAR